MLRHGLREYDLCGRWGGEEFLVLLPNTGPEAAQIVMDRLVGEIRALSVDVGGEAIRFTVSIGMSRHQLGDLFRNAQPRGPGPVPGQAGRTRPRRPWIYPGAE